MSPNPSVPRLVAVTGLAFEARIAARAGTDVVCSGNPQELAQMLQREVSKGAGGIISFGVSGGLVPDLPAGAWLIAQSVITDDHQYRTDPSWSESLMGILPGARLVHFAGVPQPLMDRRAKQGTRERTGASAADMESHIAAAVAEEHDLPFVAFRVVIDPVHRTLPPAALVGVTPSGRTDVAAVWRSVRAQPRQISDLMRVAFDAKAARTALVRGIRRLGPTLGFPAGPKDRGPEREASGVGAAALPLSNPRLQSLVGLLLVGAL